MAKENKNPVDTGEILEKKKGVFKKGKDPRRNTKGRPLGSLNFSTYRDMALKRMKDRSTGKKLDLKDVVFKYMQEALSGDNNLLDKIINRTFGKVPDRIHVSDDTEEDGEDNNLVKNFLSRYKISK